MRGVPVEDQVVEHGFCVRDALDAATVEELLASYEALGVPVGERVYRSFMDEPREVAQRVDRALKERLQPVVDELLPGRRIVLATFCAKGPGGSGVEYHQDWTFSDERQGRAIALWIPLTDVDPEGGSLAVIPGSHRWTSGLRTCSQTVQSPIVPHQEAFAARRRSLHLRAGEAVVYDTATIHGSEPNTSDADRPAVILQTVPVGVSVHHYQQDEDGVRGYVVDEDYFTTHDYEDAPVGYRTIEPWTRPVTAADFEPYLAAGPAR